MSLTFPKIERLTSKRVIDELFSAGAEVKKFPFVVKYISQKKETEGKVQIVISVPKRKAKLATDRNRLRRQIKEAYRLNKNELINFCIVNKIELALFLIYTGKEKEDYHLLETKLKVLLHELQVKLK